MLPDEVTKELQDLNDSRANAIFAERGQLVATRTSRLFALLFVLQYALGIALAVFVSPRTWSGALSETHVHVWTAVILGALLTVPPVWLAWKLPGKPSTRYVVACTQMLWSALLIHLTGGRIETHFHVFGSLAFLAFYRDWRVLVPATMVVLIDHLVRAVFWPQSVFGVMNDSVWRAFEHAAWVVFEVAFLSWSCRQSVREARLAARQQAALESTAELIEQEVEDRTEELAGSEARALEYSRTLEQANQQLERQKEELGQFTYVASHDLQEPLRKLVSFSKLLETDLGADIPAAAREDLDFITGAAHRMRALVQDLLALSRTGRAAIKPRSVGLEQCVKLALESLSARVEETDAEIILDDLPEVVGDKTLLTQLFQNLIANGIKFVPAERRPRIHVTAVGTGSDWTIGVQDNGIGMAAEYTEKVFEPFKRLHGRGQYEGTGIGLAICRKAVERHDGRIWVESELGLGSHFKFTLGSVAASHLETDNEAVSETTPPSDPALSVH